MRNYELILIIRPTLEHTAAMEAVEKISELIETHEGKVAAIDVWGRRKLAYPIDDQAEGTYVLLKTMMIPASLSDIEFNLKLNEAILRYMIVRDYRSGPYIASVTDDEEIASDEFVEEFSYEEKTYLEEVAFEEDDKEADDEALEVSVSEVIVE